MPAGLGGGRGRRAAQDTGAGRPLGFVKTCNTLAKKEEKNKHGARFAPINPLKATKGKEKGARHRLSGPGSWKGRELSRRFHTVPDGSRRFFPLPGWWARWSGSPDPARWAGAPLAPATGRRNRPTGARGLEGAPRRVRVSEGRGRPRPGRSGGGTGKPAGQEGGKFTVNPRVRPRPGPSGLGREVQLRDREAAGTRGPSIPIRRAKTRGDKHGCPWPVPWPASDQNTHTEPNQCRSGRKAERCTIGSFHPPLFLTFFQANELITGKWRRIKCFFGG